MNKQEMIKKVVSTPIEELGITKYMQHIDDPVSFFGSQEDFEEYVYDDYGLDESTDVELFTLTCTREEAAMETPEWDEIFGCVDSLLGYGAGRKHIENVFRDSKIIVEKHWIDGEEVFIYIVY